MSVSAVKRQVDVVLSAPQAKKHSVRYDGLTADGASTSYYVPRSMLAQLGYAASEPVPEKVRLTIEVA